MIKVAYLFPDFFFIGAQRGAAAIIRGLDRDRFAPIVFVMRPVGEMQSEIGDDVPKLALDNGSLFLRMRFVRIFFWPFFLNELVKKESPDAIISICGLTNFILVLWKIFFNVKTKIVGEEHQHLSNAWKNDPADSPRPWRYLYKFGIDNYHRFDVLRCVSNSAKNDFSSKWKVPVHRLRTIYPAFDLDRIRARSHGVRRHRGSCPVICSVGRLTAQKDFALLIRAFRLVRNEIPCKLVIAGAGRKFDELAKLISELDLSDDVRLAGFVEFSEEVIAAADVFVMTSVWEGFPATLVEAMALGTAVISVNCESGPSEIIRDGVNGRLVNSRRESDIKNCIIEVLGDRPARDAMAAQAKLDVQKFSLKSGVGEMEKMLIDLVGSAPND